jgi:arylsulfatase A-like enzyme
MIEMGQEIEAPGYVTDVITDKSLKWLKERDEDKPFFLMCHHKAPHRNWEPHPKYRDMFEQDIPVPPTFDDDYTNRAAAAGAAKMRVKEDMKYADLGLAQPEGGAEIGARVTPRDEGRKIPHNPDLATFKLIDKHTGEIFTFESQEALAHFKYQRYMKRYLATIASVDEGVGRMLDYLDEAGLSDNTLIIYTSDQGFFLGEHGWFDKRFIYEESFQMPFLIRYPQEIAAGTVNEDIACNVDFAPTFLDFAGLPIPDYMQGVSLRPILTDKRPDDWQDCAYHRYWMHCDDDHNAYAHYGIRTKDYKLIYWYNQALGQPGAQEGGSPPEWELFDCRNDQLELTNIYHDPAYRAVVKEMTAMLDAKMAAIGDKPAH